MPSKIILVEDLVAVPDGEPYPVPADFIVSDLAREEADRRGIELVDLPAGKVALGSDHGGFEMKQKVRSFLTELGIGYHDFGVHDESPVDYPDIALRVARSVSLGQFRQGVIIDGAGIGSCMAANRVPGVLAALCYDEATARNSREHNHANVLTLGGRMLSEQQVRLVLRTWLETPFGEARHGRRVQKILAIEKLFR